MLTMPRCGPHEPPFPLENGITGEVLPMLDDEALKDMGVSSVGQRLLILNGIYRLKEAYGLAIQEDDYIPRSEEVLANANAALGIGSTPSAMSQGVTAGSTTGTTVSGSGGGGGGGSGFLNALASEHHHQRAALPSPWALAGVLREKDERIRALEHEVGRLGEYLSRFHQDFVGVCRVLGVRNSLVADLPPLHPFHAYRTDAPSDLSHHPHHHRGASSSEATSTPLGSNTPATGVADLSFNLPSPVDPHMRRGTIDSPTTRTPVSARLGGTITHGVGGTGQPPKTSSLAQGDATTRSGPASGWQAPGSAAADRAAQLQQQQQQYYQQAGTPKEVLASDGTLAGGEGEDRRGENMSRSQSASARQQNFAEPVESPRGAPGSSGHGHSTTPVVTPTSATSTSASHLAQPAPVNQVQALTQANSRPSTSDAAQTSAQGPSATTSPTAERPSSSSSSADNPYKSFRVTLDDPCHKVLPAALKKYKINDDWKQYALFICYGNTERCLSYDEKPLLLFQKLKESKQNPVFMLRNIKDVKSPIAIANAKAEARGIKSDSSRVAKRREQLLQPGDGSSSSPGAADGRSLEAGAIGSITPAQLSSGTMQRQQGQPRYIGPAASLPNNGKADGVTRTYAVAIYPYASERDDEFDVAVGDTFIVLSKAKGWWIVQGDSKADGTGDVDPANVKAGKGDDGEAPIDRSEVEINGGGLVMESGWVPAGCLLEINKPLLTPSLASPSTASRPRNLLLPDAASEAGKAAPLLLQTETERRETLSSISSLPISPSIIISTSTPGIMLMDFSSGDTLTLNKDDKLRVFKRYNHWSYCVKEGEDHSRGWVPSWCECRTRRSSPLCTR